MVSPDSWVNVSCVEFFHLFFVEFSLPDLLFSWCWGRLLSFQCEAAINGSNPSLSVSVHYTMQRPTPALDHSIHAYRYIL